MDIVFMTMFNIDGTMFLVTVAVISGLITGKAVYPGSGYNTETKKQSLIKKMFG